MIAETGIPVAGQETIAPPRALRLLRPLQLAGPFLIALLVGAVVLFASGRDAIGTYWLLAHQKLPGSIPAEHRPDDLDDLFVAVRDKFSPDSLDLEE